MQLAAVLATLDEIRKNCQQCTHSACHR